MKKTLITELNRQFELMGIKKIITESIIKDFGVKLVNTFKVGCGTMKGELYRDLITKTLKEHPLGNWQIKTIEDLEEDVARFYRKEKTLIPPSEMNIFAKKLISLVAKESSTYKSVSEILLNVYRGINGFTQDTPTGDIIDEMIELAKKAGTDDKSLRTFEEFKQMLINKGIVDSSIPQMIKNIYLRTIVPVKPNEYWQGILTYVRSTPGFKYFYTKSVENAMNESGLRATFNEVDSLIRQFDDSIFQDKNLDFDVPAARIRISQLLEKISYGEPSAYKRIWADLKTKLPEESLKDINSPEGALNSNNIREWLLHFESSVDGVKTVKPNDYVGRLVAIGRIIKDPTVYKNMSIWAKSGRSVKRFLGEYFYGSARNTKEMDQLVKALGESGKYGYNTAERIMALFFYYPFIGGLLRTIGDYTENALIGADVIGKNHWMKDMYVFRGENLDTGTVRKAGNWDALLNAYLINIKDAFPTSKVPSFKKISVLSPAAADIITGFMESVKTGVIYERNKIKIAQDQITNQAQDTLINLKTTGINPVDKLIQEKGSLPLDTLKKINTTTIEVDTSRL